MDTISEKVIRSILEIDEYVTTATLAEITGISVSSIKHNLNWIREELERFEITLQSTPKKGFRLIATQEQRLKVFQYLQEEASKKTESFVFRKGYILDTLFQFPANYTIQLFSEELSVSRNMIQKDLEQIEKELAGFHVLIKKIRNQGVVLRGEEFNIRQAIIEHNNSKYWTWNSDTILEPEKGVNSRVSKKAYTYLTSTYPKESLWEIQKVLLEAEDFLNITITDIDFCRVIEYLADERLMIPLLKARTKEEAIISMSKVLEDLGYVEDGFCQKVLEREAFCPTSIGKGIAIPHHYKDYILRSGIVVAKLKHPITWRSAEKVNIIFLIANNFEESEKVQMLFKYLYDLIENKEQMEKIRQSQNKLEMLKNILKIS